MRRGPFDPGAHRGRAVQGLGAGAIQPVSLTVVGDLYSVAERARVQGYLASVWGMSAVVGPALGGVLAQYASWRWIFVLNLPVGALAFWLLVRRFAERVERQSHAMDYAGSALLVTGWSLVILALLEGGVAWAWGSPAGIAVLAAGLAALAAFVVVERRAAEPVVPLWVFRRRLLVGSALATMTIGWPLASTFSGRLYLRIGFRDTSLLGGAVLVASTGLGVLLSASATLWAVAGVCFLAGVGLGLVASPTIVAVQALVGWEERGLVTGTAMFSRSLGSAVGVAGFGALVTVTTTARFGSAPASLRNRLPQGADATRLALRPDAAPDVVAYVRQALAGASHAVFVALAAVSVVTFASLLLMPRRSAASSDAGTAAG